MTRKKQVHSDRDQTYLEYFNSKQCEYLKSLICEEIIEEHRKKPLGRHSEPLERLLLHFRRLPNEGKLVIHKIRESGTYRIAALSGVRGVPPSFIDDENYQTLEAAYHGVFMKQISNLKGA